MVFDEVGHEPTSRFDRHAEVADVVEDSHRTSSGLRELGAVSEIPRIGISFGAPISQFLAVSYFLWRPFVAEILLVFRRESEGVDLVD